MESLRRQRQFAGLVADGVRLDHAARDAKVDPWRALELVDSTEFLQLLCEVRPGMTSLRVLMEEAA